MLPGFNHNIRYKDEVFHVQTEDGGSRSPFVTTLLYRGGAILSSLKTPYPDGAGQPGFEQVLTEYMKEQHKGMLRRLTSGEFDEDLVRRGILPSPISLPEATEAPELEALVIAYLRGEPLPRSLSDD